jgi:hypothetical protein
MGNDSADNRLGAYPDDELSPKARAQAEVHRRTCTPCQVDLDRLASHSAEPFRVRLRRTIQKAAIFYLCFCAVFYWGMLAGYHGWFPFPLLKSVWDFVGYSNGVPVRVADKLANDFGGTPYRFLYKYAPTAAPGWKPLEIPGLEARRSKPVIRITDDAPRRYRVIVGAFRFEETLWGALLIDPEGKVVHTWRLSTDELPGTAESNYRKILYGVSVFPDGSVIFLMENDPAGIVKVDYRSQVLWTLPGTFHHSVSLTDDGGFWTFGGNMGDFDPVLTLVDAGTGKVRRTINMMDVRAANRNMHIFDLQQMKDVESSTHANAIEALPPRLANAFPGFKPGDLLVSYSTTNLLFVLDPVSLKVKWWRGGLWDRQHDPHWNPDGSISVFSNNTRDVERGTRHHSDIVAIDPVTSNSRILIHGQDYEFLCMFNGRQQLTDAGTLLITSSTQGRVFEVDRAGRVVFEFVNSYDAEEQSTLHLSNASYLGDESFDPGQFTKHR